MIEPQSTRSASLIARGVRLTYHSAQEARPQTVLDIEALEIAGGSRVAITGPSGAGKTSLLHVLTGIEKPDAGVVDWDGVDLASLGERDRDRWRRTQVGLVFQEFHLVPGMTVLQNVLLADSFSRFRPSAALIRRARDILDQVAAPPSHRLVDTLSRGEQQRVALARALAHSPHIIVADEPTASLDAENGARIAQLLFETTAQAGQTLIVVSHDARLIATAERVLWLEGGKLSEGPAASLRIGMAPAGRDAPAPPTLRQPTAPPKS